jgi:glycosyltransferase involved in cell wall biosynthesis
MVINPNRPEIESILAMEQPENVEIVESIARADVPEAMERSILLINTSLFEGLPNTMLEAFRAGTPVVSLSVDPNQVIETYGCGRVVNGDIAAMAAAVLELATDSGAWEAASSAARDYVMRTHATDVIIDQVIEVVQSAFDGNSS